MVECVRYQSTTAACEHIAGQFTSTLAMLTSYYSYVACRLPALRALLQLPIEGACFEPPEVVSHAEASLSDGDGRAFEESCG